MNKVLLPSASHGEAQTGAGAPAALPARWLQLCLAFAALVAFTAVAVPSASAVTGYNRVGAFAQPFPDGQADHQKRIAVNHDTGDIYVTDQVGDQIAVYRPNSTGADLLTTFGMGNVTDPFGIAIDQNTGDVYVSDDNDVVKYSSDGAPAPTFTLDGSFASPGVTGPLAFDQGNDQLVAGDRATNTVRRYSISGVAGDTFDGSAGAGSPGAFAGIQDLAVDNDGDIIVVDSTGDPALGNGISRVERYASDGNWKATIGPVSQAATVAVKPSDNSIVVSGNQDAVNRDESPTLNIFSASGADWRTAEVDSSVAFSTIYGLASDDEATGRFYVATDVDKGFAGAYGLVSVQAYQALEVPPPGATTDPAEDVGADRATLLGQVDPNETVTTYSFEYGPTTAYGKSVPMAQNAAAGAGADPRVVSRLVTGLQPNTEYHFRLVAKSFVGTTESADRTFTTAPRATADTCPNAAVRAQQKAEGLKDCRAYEQVSPVDKKGYSIAYGNRRFFVFALNAASRTEDTAVFNSFGGFAGSDHASGPVQYRSKRTASGWTTKVATPAPTVSQPNLLQQRGVVRWAAATPDLSKGLVKTDNAWSAHDTNEAPRPGDARLAQDFYTVGPEPGDSELVSHSSTGAALGGVLENAGGANYEFAFARHGNRTAFTTTTAGVPEDTDTFFDVYTGGPQGTQLVSGDIPAADEECGASIAQIADAHLGRRRNFSAISADGAVVVFQTPSASAVATNSACQTGNVLRRFYARINGARTEEISASQRTTPDPSGPQSAEFISMAEDGSRILFITQEALIDSVAPSSGAKLYSYDVSSGQLSMISENFAEIVAVSDDAKRLYFTRGNVIYRYDNGQVVPVAEKKDESVSLLIDNFLMAPDGAAGIFLSRSDFGFDSGGSQQLYLSRPGQPLRCLSCGTEGQSASGDVVISIGAGGDGGASVADAGTYASSISDDGSKVAFQTPRALVSTDINNRDDIYLWDDGRLSLVTPGTGNESSELLGMSADGANIYFTTGLGLVKQDIDGGDLDVYDARVNGGFLASAAADGQAGCNGDECQGARPVPPGTSAPGSLTLQGRANPKADPRPTLKLALVSAAQRRAAVTFGRLTVKVETNTAGTITGSLRARIGLRTVRVATAKKKIAQAGTHTLTLTLSSQARRQLKRSGSLTLRGTMRFSGVSTAKTFSVRLARSADAHTTTAQKGQ